MYYGVVDFFIGFLAGLKAFTAAVLGGIGSLPRRCWRLADRPVEAFYSAYFSIEYKTSRRCDFRAVLIFARAALGGRGSRSLSVAAAGARQTQGRVAGPRSPRWSRSPGGAAGRLRRSSRAVRSLRDALGWVRAVAAVSPGKLALGSSAPPGGVRGRNK